MKLRFRVCYNESAFNFKANVMNKKKRRSSKKLIEKVAYHIELFHIFI